MALSSNFYQQMKWTGKGIVRFSDSLALGKASGLRNLTRKGINTEILKFAWEENRERKEMEKSWTNCEIAISEQFQISNLLKMLHVCLLSTNSEFSSALKSKVNDTLGADDWRRAFPRIERTPICRSKPRRARLHLQSLSYSRGILLSSQTSQSWLPARKRSATNRGPGRG